MSQALLAGRQGESGVRDREKEGGEAWLQYEAEEEEEGLYVGRWRRWDLWETIGWGEGGGVLKAVRGPLPVISPWASLEKVLANSPSAKH